jgi:hypothetical protein
MKEYDSPAFQVVVDDEDITNKIAPRLISFTLNECGGDESDQLDLALSDADGMLAIPPRGAAINVQIGWKKSGLVDKGVFTVDEVEHSGTPDQITLRARTANFTASFRQVQTETFHDTTLGGIIELIAFKNELRPGISESLRNVVVPHIDQTRESDGAFLRRLGKKYDATATVKNDTLLFIPINACETASGKPLPVIIITRDLGDCHRYQSAERDSYSGVRVFWHDTKSTMRRSVVAGSAGNTKNLRTTYSTEADARQAAVAEWQRIQRGLATFELALAEGNPQLMPKSPVKVSGFKPAIDAVEWQATRVCHSITKNGFTSRIEMETKTEEAEAEREPQSDPDIGITGVFAKWRDKVRNKTGTAIAPTTGTRQNRKPVASASNNPKILSASNGHEDVYDSKASAQRAADVAWANIVETREIIAENNNTSALD